MSFSLLVSVMAAARDRLPKLVRRGKLRTKEYEGYRSLISYITTPIPMLRSCCIWMRYCGSIGLSIGPAHLVNSH